jgi:Na+-translocating ferredoxin:NAD+ oxidoreductase RnfE subunit
MDDLLRQLAQRDAKAIRGGIAAVGVATVVAVVGLFTPALVGGVAIILGVFAQLNCVMAWAAGPKAMAERRPVLAPAVVAGIPMALGAYTVFGGVGAIVASLPAAVIATVVIGMKIASERV